LAQLRKISLAGVEFNSEVDGQRIFSFSRKSIRDSKNLNSDIAMILDYCVGYPAKKQK